MWSGVNYTQTRCELRESLWIYLIMNTNDNHWGTLTAMWQYDNRWCALHDSYLLVVWYRHNFVIFHTYIYIYIWQFFVFFMPMYVTNFLSLHQIVRSDDNGYGNVEFFLMKMVMFDVDDVSFLHLKWSIKKLFLTLTYIIYIQYIYIILCLQQH